MASSSSVVMAEVVGTRASVGSILVNTYSGAKGYAFSNWKRAVKQLLEHERPKSDKAVYSATTQLAHIEGTITPYSKAAAWMKWVRTALTHDMALADINHFPSMDLVPYVEGMEDDWTSADVLFDFSTAKDMKEWFVTDVADAQALPDPKPVPEKKATKDGRLLSPHDGVIEKFWFYAERKFGHAETTAVIAFTAMKQGQPLEGEQVSPKESELEFASRVKAHHATLRKEYTDQQAMQIYLDGLHDQTLAHWVAMRAGLLELSKQTVTNAATEIEQLLKYKVGAEHLQLLREARQKKTAKSIKVDTADTPASDPRRHAEAPCYLHPDKEHTNNRCFTQHPELKILKPKAAAHVVAPVQSQTAVWEEKLDKLVQLMSAHFTSPAQSSEYTKPAPKYALGSNRPPPPPPPRHWTECETCRRPHPTGQCYIEDPSKAPPGWKPPRSSPPEVMQLWEENCKRKGVKFAGNATVAAVLSELPQSLIPSDDELPGEIYEVFSAGVLNTLLPVRQVDALVTTRSAVLRPCQTLPGPVLQGRHRTEQSHVNDERVGVYDTPIQITVYVGRDADIIADLQVRNQQTLDGYGKPKFSKSSIVQSTSLASAGDGKALSNMAGDDPDRVLHLQDYNTKTAGLCYFQNTHPQTGCVLVTPDKRQILCQRILVDTGSTVPIVSARYAKQIGLHYRASDKYKLNSVDAKEKAILGLTGPCELVLAKNTEYQVTIPVPEFLVVDEPHGMYDILLGQPQLYRHAVYLDPLLGIVYRPFWQTKKDGETIHVLPSTSSVTSTASVGTTTIHEVSCIATQLAPAMTLDIQSVSLSTSQGGGCVFAYSDHEQLYSDVKGEPDHGDVSDEVKQVVDQVFGPDHGDVSDEVKQVVDQMFGNVIVGNMVDAIFHNLISETEMFELWASLGSCLAHTAHLARAECNKLEKLQKQRYYLSCFQGEATGNLVVPEWLWTLYGTRIPGHLQYLFTWECLRSTCAFPGVVVKEVGGEDPCGTYFEDCRTPVDSVILTCDRVGVLESALMSQLDDGSLLAIHRMLTMGSHSHVHTQHRLSISAESLLPRAGDVQTKHEPGVVPRESA